VVINDHHMQKMDAAGAGTPPAPDGIPRANLVFSSALSEEICAEYADLRVDPANKP